ncbi:MAG: hypothetical protein ACHQ02_01230 [Candidatus Limnocylindrales bacterium]
MADRTPPPGPSYARERIVRLHAGPSDPGVAVRVGMSHPTETGDGWWLTHLWAFDADGVIDTLTVAPRAGPPASPPLQLIGPSFAGSLAGLIAEEDGRRLVRLRLHPAADETRPWERPCIVQVAIKWEPIRAATMRPNDLAAEVVQAFARALESAGSPG